ncbi:MAG: hypothetical protein FWH00_04320, partial [Oscillospiraceae bacterium]|nr:hypothetical protein [Oscillospiraceae bacterium]
GVLKTVRKCIGAYLGGALFCLMFASSYSTVSVASQIFYTMLGAVMFGVVAELIMSRGARMILKNSVWILGTGAVTCLIFLGIRFDLMGYADYVPRADQVRSVSINYQDRFQSTGRGPRFDDNLTDPGIIATVVNSHRLAVENKPKPVIRERTGMSGSVSIENEYRPYYHIRITYTLNSGRKVTRAYNDYAPAAALELLNLETNAQFIATRSPLFNPAYNWNNATIHLWDSLQIDSTALMIDYVKRDQLLEALRADILGETLAEIKDPSAPAHGMLQIRNRLSGDATDILITHEYTRTMALLGAWGYSDFLSSVHSKYDTMYLMLYTSGWADESRIQTFNASWLRGNINNNLGYNGEIRTDTQILDGDFARHTQAIRITDTSLYSTLHGQAQERLLMNQYRGGEYSPVYHLVYAQGEQIVGGRFMHPGRLPPQLREIADAVNAFEAQAMPEDDREWELYANEVTGTKLIW